MARIEKRPKCPAKIGNVSTSPSAFGAKCSRCGDTASKRWRNAYRASDVCSEKACSDNEFRWVGNFPHVAPVNPRPQQKPETTVTKPVHIRGYDARTGERKPPVVKKRSIDFNDPQYKEKRHLLP